MEYTDKVIYIDDEEVVSLKLDHDVDITTIGNVQKTPEIKRLELSLSQLEKGGYPHFTDAIRSSSESANARFLSVALETRILRCHFLKR